MDSDGKDIFVRELELESQDTTLRFLQQNVGDVNCVVWDAAIVLAKYLDITSQKKKWLHNKKILELGAGLGCAGLTAACLRANVVLTDLESGLPMLEKNVKANEDQWKKFGGSATAQVLEWGKNISIDFEPEIILLTDCVYYDESIEPLLDILQELVKDGTYAILSQEKRDTPKQVAVWKKFLEGLHERFKIEIIPTAEQHSMYSSPDIYLMKIHCK